MLFIPALVALGVGIAVFVTTACCSADRSTRKTSCDLLCAPYYPVSSAVFSSPPVDSVRAFFYLVRIKLSSHIALERARAWLMHQISNSDVSMIQSE